MKKIECSMNKKDCLKTPKMDRKEYNLIHDWLRRNKKGDVCEICGIKNTALDNALKSGYTHEKNVESYLKLCRKCHYHYDHPEGLTHSKETKIKIADSSRDRILKKGVHDNFKYSQRGVKMDFKRKINLSLMMRGENHHQSKLTERQVISILKSTLSSRDLAIKYNVTYRTIRNIISKRTWKHLN